MIINWTKKETKQIKSDRNNTKKSLVVHIRISQNKNNKKLTINIIAMENQVWQIGEDLIGRLRLDVAKY